MNALHTSEIPSVCIVIPVCNEEELLPMLGIRLQELQCRLARDYRLHYIFVDDGSSDATSQLLPQTVPDGISFELHTHAQNQGVGAAFRTAFQHANADVVCTIDADCSYGPEHLLEMIQEVHSGRTDVIVASPYHPQGTVENVQHWRLVLSRQCSRLYRAVSPLKLYTYTSIFRAYKGDSVRKIQFRSDGFVAAVEILVSAHQLGLRISEMPMTLRRRSAGVSKMRIARTIRNHAALMLDCLIAGKSRHPSFCTANRARIHRADLHKPNDAVQAHSVRAMHSESSFVQGIRTLTQDQKKSGVL